MFELPKRDAYLTEAETADLLGFSVAKLRDLRRGRRIGSAAIGRHILHSGKHIRDFLKACEQQTGQEAPPTEPTGSASEPAATHGTELGSIPEHARRAAQASAQQTFKPPTKGSRSGGRKIAA